jgi:hypothetical protein
MEFSFKQDQFSQHRGGESLLLKLYCSNCQTQLMIYQKDGGGELKRCYFDRIYWLSVASNNSNNPSTVLINPTETELKSYNLIICSHCQTVIGYPSIYLPEKRLALQLEPQALQGEIYLLGGD